MLLVSALLLGTFASLATLPQALAADTGFGTTSLDRQYLGNPLQTHYVAATGLFSCCGISNEGTLGYLLNEPRAGTVALYNCYQGSQAPAVPSDYIDFFLSRDAACEGQRRWNPTQAEGYIYTAPPNDGNAVDALYRCRRAINGHLDHFATTLANCEGQISEGPLGYVKHNPQFAPLPQDPTTASTVALNRYFNDSSTYGNNHWVTTGPVTPDFHPEGPVAHLLKSPLQGTVPLYGCYARQQIPGDSDHDGNIDDDDFYNHDDHFVSTDVNCEGWKPDNTLGGQYLHMLGFVFQKAVQGATVPIYRCHRTGDHYVTQAANCEGAGASEGILGYALPRTAELRVEGPFSDSSSAGNGNKFNEKLPPEIRIIGWIFSEWWVNLDTGARQYQCSFGEIFASNDPPNEIDVEAILTQTGQGTMSDRIRVHGFQTVEGVTQCLRLPSPIFVQELRGRAYSFYPFSVYPSQYVADPPQLPINPVFKSLYYSTINTIVP